MTFFPEAGLRWAWGSLLLGRRLPCLGTAARMRAGQKARGKHGGAGLDQLSRPERERPSFPVCVYASSQQQSVRIRPQSNASLAEDASRATWPAFSSVHQLRTRLGQMSSTHVCWCFVHLRHKGTGLREQKVATGIQYISLG